MQFAFHLVLGEGEGKQKPIFIELWMFPAVCYVSLTLLSKFVLEITVAVVLCWGEWAWEGRP